MNDSPRLLLANGRLDRLRDAVATTHAAQFRRLLDQCDHYADANPPGEHPEESITYIGPAVAGFALAHRLTDQAQYLTHARRWLAVATRYPHWGRAHLPDHDLDAEWLLHGLSLSYDWLRDRLPERETDELRDKLALQAGRLHEYAVQTEGRWWSSSYWQNHNWICHAGLLTAGYALAGEHTDAPAWVERATANFRVVARELPEDGSDCEGVVYWRYGVPWLAIAFDLLADQDGPDLFGQCAFLRNTFWYRLYQAVPGWQHIVDHGDCHDRRSGHSIALYHKLASAYRISQAQWLAELVRSQFLGREMHESGVRPGVRAEGYLELLWYDPSVAAQPPDDLPTAAYFPDLGLVSARTGWDEDATLVSFKAAPGGGHKAWATSRAIAAERGWDTLNAGHHHPDAGTFVLFGCGAYLAVEDGYVNRKQAANHNVILVDGVGYTGDGSYHVYAGLPLDHQAQVRDVRMSDGWVHAIADLAAMYPRELGVAQVARRVVFSPSGCLLLVDEVAARAERTWTWLLHADQPGEPLDDGRILVRSGTGQLLVHPLGGGRLSQATTEDVANPTSSTPRLTVGRTLHTLRIDTGPASTARFVTLLMAGSALAELPTCSAVVEGDRVMWQHDGWDEEVVIGGGRVAATAGHPSSGRVRSLPDQTP